MAMSNQDILERAIRKAIDGGFDLVKCGKEMNFEHFLTGNEENNYFRPAVAMRGYSFGIIFNHDFAKALWGERYEGMDGVPDFRSGWPYHLQQMVVADDPIKYLGDHLG